MNIIDITKTLKLQCAECKADLHGEIEEQRRGDDLIVVQPCECCIGSAVIDRIVDLEL